MRGACCFRHWVCDTLWQLPQVLGTVQGHWLQVWVRMACGGKLEGRVLAQDQGQLVAVTTLFQESLQEESSWGQ